MRHILGNKLHHFAQKLLFPTANEVHDGWFRETHLLLKLHTTALECCIISSHKIVDLITGPASVSPSHHLRLWTFPNTLSIAAYALSACLMQQYFSHSTSLILD